MDETSKPQEESVCLAGKKTYIHIDASTEEGAKNYKRSYSCEINSAQLSDTLYLDLKSQYDMGYIYITKVEDNGNPQRLITNTALMTDDFESVAPSGVSQSFSYEIAPSYGPIKALKLKVPVTIRASATMSDVYCIWVTSIQGDFSVPTKNKIIGPIKVFLKYGQGLTYSTIRDTTMGDQNAIRSGFMATIGRLGTVQSALITTDTAFRSVDVNFVSLNENGDSLGSIPNFIAPSIRDSLKFKDFLYAGARRTRYAPYGGSSSFESFNGQSLLDLPTPTANRVVLQQGKMYVFQTQDGRKGIIKVDTLKAEPRLNGGNLAVTSIKVLD